MTDLTALNDADLDALRLAVRSAASSSISAPPPPTSPPPASPYKETP